MSDFLEDKFLYLPDGSTEPLKEYFTEQDFVLDNGQPFIKHGPMLKIAKKVLGITGKEVKVIQFPSESNNMTAVVSVRYTFGDGKIIWESTADCGPHNSPPRIGNMYPTAMAETRAEARALRFVLGIDFCSKEEIGVPVEQDDDNNDNKSIERNQKAVIQKKFIDTGKYTLKDISDLIGRTVKELESLSKSEAAQTIKKFNSKRR